MKSISEFINESLRLDEAKKVKASNILKGLDKIEKWCSANNIKKLMSEYMSAGDAEEFDKKHWDACEDAVSWIADILKTYIENQGEDFMDISDLTSWIADTIGNEKYYNELNDIDEEGDWDEDSIIDLFNTVSMKVCKETWLI